MLNATLVFYTGFTLGTLFGATLVTWYVGGELRRLRKKYHG